MSSKILEGKVGVVVGVANKRSIAFAIAKAWHEAGAKLIFNYQGERLKDGVIKLIHENFGEDAPVYDLDVSSDESINAFFENVRKHTDKVDCMLHSVAFAPKEALGGGSFLETGRDAFKISLDISAYSLVALSRAVEPMMSDNGSILAMSYLGSEKVVPNYNLMGVSKAALEACTRYLAYDLGRSRGIRVNCISAGPMQTLAARGVSGFSTMFKVYEEHAPPGPFLHGRGTGRYRRIPGQRRRRRHHRPGDLRGRRLPDHGHVTLRDFIFPWGRAACRHGLFQAKRDERAGVPVFRTKKSCTPLSG